MAKAREDAEARMADFLAPHQRQGRNLRPICRPGEPADALRRGIRSVRAELLVVGKHALFGAGRPLLGTVAERSLRVAPCDVLVVPGRSPTIH
jgi:nucleotide-binding universal stress UspA family protein